MNSSAQSILSHILEQIIAYASGVQRVTENRPYMPPYQLNGSFIPFLGVCRKWRSVAVALMYQEVSGAIDSECSEFYELGYFIPGMTAAARIGAEQLVKAVHLHISFRGILNGSAESLLLSGPLKNTVFGNASELIVTLEDMFIDDDDEEVRGAELGTSVREFAAGVSRMFPAVRYPFFDVGMVESPKYHDRIAQVIDLIAAGKQGLSINSPVEWHRSLAFPGIVGLEYISLSRGMSGETHVELIRKSNRTLGCIRLYGAIPQTIYDIVCDSNGNQIEYPAVSKCEFAMETTQRTTRLTPPARSPFPNMSHFSCKSAYPFTSLSLLEGCRSLESLHLYVDNGVKEMFEKSGWLDRNHFPNLRYIHFEPISLSRGDHGSPSSLMLLQVALGLSQNIEAIKVDSEWIGKEPSLMRTLQEHSCLSKLQALDLPYAPFTYGEIARITELFPSMKRCAVSLIRTAPNTRLHSTENTTEWLQQWTDPGARVSQLLHLRICTAKGLSVMEIYDQVFLLAVSVPSLKRIEVPCASFSPELQKSMARAMQSEMFSAHRHRLSNILVFPVVMSEWSW